MRVWEGGDPAHSWIHEIGGNFLAPPLASQPCSLAWRWTSVYVSYIMDSSDRERYQQMTTETALIGSEKQVTWATEIRTRVLDAITEEMREEAARHYQGQIEEDMGGRLPERLIAKTGTELVQMAVDYLESQTEARFWIDEMRYAFAPVALDFAAKAVSPNTGRWTPTYSNYRMQ